MNSALSHEVTATDSHSQNSLLNLACLNALGGMAAGWFFFVFRQGRIHLYQGVGKNEYFEPEGGLDYLGWGTLLWIASGALVGLALFFLCGLLNAKSRE
ncbi:MAG: hypothetical protein QF437_14830, partial [Planctomycetota bacterium]|nr:hypothetical protein [Planctomycetota bacterium]